MADEEEEDVNTAEPEAENADGGAGNDAGEEDEQEEGEEGEQEPTDKIVPKPLTLSIMQKSLTMLCKTSSGMHHAFVKFDCRNQEITDISLLQNYPHLRYIDVSNNLIPDVTPLNNIKQILLLNCDNNKLSEFHLHAGQFLRLLSLAGNQLETCGSFQNFPMLEQLILNFNHLQSAEGFLEAGDKLSQLHTLELRGNQLTSTKGLRLPSLRNLYLAQDGPLTLTFREPCIRIAPQNKLERLEDISYNTGLKTLHLRDNRLARLTGFAAELVNLEYINLRQNRLEKGSQLRKLQCLSRLSAIALTENPLSTDDDYRIQVIAYLPKLTRIDKDPVDEDLRAEGEAFVAEGKLEEEEEEVEGPPQPADDAAENNEEQQDEPAADTNEAADEVEEEEDNG